jgi:AraC-like DNA-binding protein
MARSSGVIVAALVLDPGHRLVLRRGLRGVAEVHFCERIEGLRALVRRSPLHLVITVPIDKIGRPVAATVAEIRQGFPSLPVIAYCALTPADTHSLIALVRAGADEVIIRDFDDVGSVAIQVIARAAASRVGERAFAELSPFVSASVRPILGYCLNNPVGATAVDDIAHALGIARRTLVSRLAGAGLPGPAALITWSRLLAAAHLLEDPARSVDQVAAALRFRSGGSLRVTCKRYTGLRPLDLRARGGHRHILDLIRNEMGMEQRAIG